MNECMHSDSDYFSDYHLSREDNKSMTDSHPFFILKTSGANLSGLLES